MQAVFLDRNTVDRGDIDFSQLLATPTRWTFYETTPAGERAKHVKDAEIILTNKTPIDAPTLANAPRLRLICLAATGYDNIDLVATQRAGVTVCNVRRYATPSVVQHVFALILSLTTHLSDYQRAVRGGNWQHCRQFSLLEYDIQELAGQTLGIVGYGELGSAVANVAKAFGMTVLISQRPGAEDNRPDRLPLKTLLPQVDVLSLHCPLTEATRGLIGPAELALMKPTALLINAARGGIVDEAALADALRHSRLKGAGVDVLSEEPPVHGNPLLSPDIPNLIVTPHIAWASHQSRQRVVNEMAKNIEAFIQGKPRNVVRP